MTQVRRCEYKYKLQISAVKHYKNKTPRLVGRTNQMLRILELSVSTCNQKIGLDFPGSEHTFCFSKYYTVLPTLGRWHQSVTFPPLQRPNVPCLWTVFPYHSILYKLRRWWSSGALHKTNHSHIQYKPIEVSRTRLVFNHGYMFRLSQQATITL